uniref:beta-defensin 118 n=1 Tax=Jaculus jaculus TaxID=51337 RepID=UPI001E1B203B|nr:beta-defensin 118 [Jaculus jaculus]
MRLLLLALSILVFLPQVIPAIFGEKMCLRKSGQCRKMCKDGEIIKKGCRAHQVCCIPDANFHKKEAITREDETSPIGLFPLDYMDVYKTAATLDYLLADKANGVEEELSERMKTQTSVP